MPLKTGYALLTGTAVAHQRETGVDTPHQQVHVRDEAGVSYRVPINVRSQSDKPDLLYLVDEDFHHPVTAAVESLGSGRHTLGPGPGGPNLDYVRANLFDPAKMRVLPGNVEGPDNDLQDILEPLLDRAIADQSARIHVFGAPWGPETEPDKLFDKVFGFTPGNGVHEIHMNQGNDGVFERDDGVWQDGGLLLHFPAADRWVAVFLAFQSQKFHTDDAAGHAIDREVPSTVQIAAALVNPVGPAPEQERVLLINASPDAVDLTGWQLADKAKQKCPVPGGPLAPGATLQVELAAPVQLGNHGGIITLLDAAGLKASGVSYTEQQAQREGWTIVF
jgi:uncharacterized protein YukJ